jgi:hypothetical protein
MYVPGPPAKLAALVPTMAWLAAVCAAPLTTNVPVFPSADATMVACAPALPRVCADTVPVHGTVNGVQGFVERALTAVPGHTPAPESTMLLASTPPSAMAVMVSAVPEMKPVTVAVPSVYALMGMEVAVCDVAAALAQVVVLQGGAEMPLTVPDRRVLKVTGAAEEPTVCETLTVYVPTPPVPVPHAVTTVPAVMPPFRSGTPAPRIPEVTLVTVSVPPAPARVALAALCEALTAYVPAPPAVPDSCAVIKVPAAVVPPVMTMPTVSAQEVQAKTVSVLPAMAPVTLAPASGEMKPAMDTGAVEPKITMPLASAPEVKEFRVSAVEAANEPVKDAVPSAVTVVPAATPAVTELPAPKRTIPA